MKLTKLGRGSTHRAAGSGRAFLPRNLAVLVLGKLTLQATGLHTGLQFRILGMPNPLSFCSFYMCAVNVINIIKTT